jgi:hypothetical protein
MSNIINGYQIKNFYKPKEKIDMILEPLQAMIQLSLLSRTPIGTKLAIQENILYLQTPTFIQPISRWYNADKKDDLYFLFQVIKRFIKWYNPSVSSKSPLSKELYELIIKMSIDGLNNLLKTYSSSDCNAVTQVITLYKHMLETNESIDDKNMSDTINMDEVFENVIKLYEKNIIIVMYSTLQLINDEENNMDNSNYIDGINNILIKTNKLIKEWVKSNLIL